ncbi:MAG: helix-turn-helix domain-containing protein [Armatimonadota bacterium]
MTTFAKKLNAEDDILLKQLAACDDAVVRRRARSILMSMEGIGTHQIAEELAWSERSVRNTVVAFNRDGIDSVSRRLSPGRMRMLSDVKSETLLEIISRPPSDFGMEDCNWSLASLASTLKKLGLCAEVSRRTLGRELVRRGIDWSNAKLDLAQSASCAGITMDAPDAGRRENTSATEPMHDHGPSIKRRLYADMLLTPEDGARYDEIIKGLREDFPVSSNVDEMHIQLAAVCYLKLAKAHLAEDWEKAEHMDRMLKGHLMELKAAKKRQQSTEPGGDSPAEWATEVLESLAALEGSGGPIDVSELSKEDFNDQMRKSYERWKERRLSQ